MTIPTHLIENALNLTGKKIWDIQELKWEPTHCETYQFSIEKFSYFLLSPEFIEKYMPILFPFEIIGDIREYYEVTAKDFWWPIYQYQSWNPWPLISLLEMIPWTHTL